MTSLTTCIISYGFIFHTHTHTHMHTPSPTPIQDGPVDRPGCHHRTLAAQAVGDWRQPAVKAGVQASGGRSACLSGLSGHAVNSDTDREEDRSSSSSNKMDRRTNRYTVAVAYRPIDAPTLFSLPVPVRQEMERRSGCEVRPGSKPGLCLVHLPRVSRLHERQRGIRCQ